MCVCVRTHECMKQKESILAAPKHCCPDDDQRRSLPTAISNSKLYQQTWVMRTVNLFDSGSICRLWKFEFLCNTCPWNNMYLCDNMYLFDNIHLFNNMYPWDKMYFCHDIFPCDNTYPCYNMYLCDNMDLFDNMHLCNNVYPCNNIYLYIDTKVSEEF